MILNVENFKPKRGIAATTPRPARPGSWQPRALCDENERFLLIIEETKPCARSWRPRHAGVISHARHPSSRFREAPRVCVGLAAFRGNGRRFGCVRNRNVDAGDPEFCARTAAAVIVATRLTVSSSLPRAETASC